jgi:hypothetical protein
MSTLKLVETKTLINEEDSSKRDVYIRYCILHLDGVKKIQTQWSPIVVGAAEDKALDCVLALLEENLKPLPKESLEIEYEDLVDKERIFDLIVKHRLHITPTGDGWDINGNYAGADFAFAVVKTIWGIKDENKTDESS